MSKLQRIVVAFVGVSLVASSPLAGPPPNGHLLCFVVKDPAKKFSYRVKISDEGGAAVDCVVKVPAKQLCFGRPKTNVTPMPPNGEITGPPLSFSYLCYKAKCPKAPTSVSLVDQFGNRAIGQGSSKTLCVPTELAV